MSNILSHNLEQFTRSDVWTLGRNLINSNFYENIMNPIHSKPALSHAAAARPGNRPAFGKIAMFLLVLAMADVNLYAHAFSVHHNLQIALIPKTHELAGVDEMEIRGKVPAVVNIRVSPETMIRSIRMNGKPADFSFLRGMVKLVPPGNNLPDPCRIAISYTAIYNDPVPTMPVNMDNPGYGVTGTITEKGTFLLAGAGWYPEIENAVASYTLHITAPKGILAVTAGRSLGHVTDNGKTVSTWQVDRPVEGLSLSAARYVVSEKAIGQITAATYFSTENHHLAADYLEATAKYIAMYTEMFGPYPFDKFAVVENFFPTGFGFPSYTLMGSRVLRLPFIIHTSLGHEIAHCWWGNGVTVDYAEGNWCEGLTAYVADYLYKEKMSPAAALDQRRQLLRNYADLVDPEHDFPLEQFQGRHDRVTRSVGYDKAAMVFHMLRQRIGDKAFWGALRDIYSQRLFQVTSWNDLKTGFERRANLSLDVFFRQWISRPGAVRLSLKDISAEPAKDGWRVSGRLVQQAPFYEADVQLSVESETCVITKKITLTGAETPFDIDVYEKPLHLSADPGYHIFRRLYPSEMPPSVNTLKGSASVLIIAPENLDDGLRASATLLIRSLGIQRFAWADETLLTSNEMNQNDLLFVGLPKDRNFMPKVYGQVKMTDKSFDLNEKSYNGPGDVFFGVFDHPTAENKVAAVFLPLSGEQAGTAARKITHYGKYSYLAFSNGRNLDKGFWPVTVSPLVHRWE